MKTVKVLSILALLTGLLFASCEHDPLLPAPNNNGGNNNGGGNNGGPVDPNNPSFASDILPIFISNCTSCHNDNLANDEYNFTTYEKIKAKKFVAGNLDDTKLYQAITEDSEQDRMPPAPRARLSADKILLIKNWILNGAPNN